MLVDQAENPQCRANLNGFAYLNGGVDKEEFGKPACGFNSTLIGVYKSNMLAHVFDCFWVLENGMF